MLDSQCYNRQNAAFYECLPLDVFENYAKLAGLEQCPDLQFLQDYIADAQLILEIGAGYGRVLEWILQHHPKGKMIDAIERSERLFSYLERKYSKVVNLINDDVLDHSFSKQYDLILCLWESIGEFSPNERQTLINNIINHLANGGRFAIDILSPELVSKNFVSKDKSVGTLSYDASVLNVALSSKVEYCHYLSGHEDVKLDQQEYISASGRTRIMNIFHKYY